jgi:hypothetical protein
MRVSCNINRGYVSGTIEKDESAWSGADRSTHGDARTWRRNSGLQPGRHRLCLVGQRPPLKSRAPSLHPRYQASSLIRARPPLRLASVLCSVNDRELLRPLRTRWPRARHRPALGGVYLPGEYISEIKRPGKRYILNGILKGGFRLLVAEGATSQPS